jgi:hypothetical protein
LPAISKHTSTGIGRGGKRAGSGRPQGALGENKQARELIARAKAEALEMPIDRLIRRLNDPELSEEYSDKLAAVVVPYTAPRLSSVAIAKRPAQMSDEEIAQLCQKS